MNDHEDKLNYLQRCEEAFPPKVRPHFGERCHKVVRVHHDVDDSVKYRDVEYGVCPT